MFGRYGIEGYKWCASIDLENFFDKIPHELILKLIRRKIADERLVTLIARAIKAGVIVDGKFEKTTEGMPARIPSLTHAVQHRPERTGSGT